jgi:hypothetical protein
MFRPPLVIAIACSDAPFSSTGAAMRFHMRVVQRYLLVQGRAQQSSRHGMPERLATPSSRKAEACALSLIGRGGAEQLRELVEVRGRDIGDGQYGNPSSTQR